MGTLRLPLANRTMGAEALRGVPWHGKNLLDLTNVCIMTQNFVIKRLQEACRNGVKWVSNLARESWRSMTQPAMRAAVFYGHNDVRVEEVRRPEPGPGELLLRVCAAGICGTDAHEFVSGPHMYPGQAPHPASGQALPMVIGHEFAGRVMGWGAGVSGFDEGDLVVCGAGVSCGSCIQCTRGQTNLCESYWTVGLQRNGGLAEFVTAPAEICFPTEQFGLTDDLAGIAQPMAIAVHAARRGRASRNDHAIILGAGGIGAFVVHAVATECDMVGVVDLVDERLAIAERNGASHSALLSNDLDIEAKKREWGIRPNLVFEVSGTTEGLAAARQWLEPGGRLVLVGIQGGEGVVDFRDLSLKEFEVIGTNAHVVARDVPRALGLLASGGAWSEIAPDILPLDLIVSEGLQPLAERRSSRIKTLFDPTASEKRSTHMTLETRR